jgi:hypothetical protein
MECTILAYIDTGTSALSIQNKRHLHWKALDLIPSMNNEVKFVTLAHNLLRKTDAENTTHQALKNRSTNILASPKAPRKKRFTKLDLMLLMSTRKDNIVPTRTDQKAEDGDQELPPGDNTRILGSIGPLTARNRLIYD